MRVTVSKRVKAVKPTPAKARSYMDLHALYWYKKEMPSMLKSMVSNVSVATDLGSSTEMAKYSPSFQNDPWLTNKFFMPIIANKTETDIFVDSGADCCLISKNIADRYYPDWKNKYRSAGQIEIRSHSKHSLQVIATRHLPMSFPVPGKTMFFEKFAITNDKDEFILGKLAIRRQRIGLEWKETDKGTDTLFAVVKNAQGEQHRMKIEELQRNATGVSISNVSIKAYKTDLVTFEVPFAHGTTVVISSVTQGDNAGVGSANCIVLASLDKVKGQNQQLATALVQNLTNERLQLIPGDLFCMVSPIDIKNYDVLNIEDVLDPATLVGLDERLGKQPTAVVKQCVVHPRIPSILSLDQITDQDKAEDSRLEDILDKEEVFVDFEVPFQGPESEMTKQVEMKILDLIPFATTKPKYHRYLRRLFLEKYPETVGLRDDEAGNISRTCGFCYIPLAAPLPKSRKIFHQGGKKLEQSMMVVQRMMNVGVLEHSKAQYCLPSFIIPRKQGPPGTPEKLPRYLVDCRDLNEVSADTGPTVLPDIRRSLEALMIDGLHVASVLDNKQAFFSVKIAPFHRSRMAVSTELGVLQMVSLPMGYISSPKIYQGLQTKLLHLDPITQMFDPVPKTIPFIDDVAVVQPIVPGLSDEELDHQHYLQLDKILSRYSYHQVKVSLNKSVFFSTKLKVWGMEISKEGLKVDNSRIEAIQSLSEPKDKKMVQRLLGILASCSAFCGLDVSRAAAVLSPLTSPKKDFVFNDEHRTAFLEIKKLLSLSDLFLAIPKRQGCRLLYTDSSTKMLGAIMFEVELEPQLLAPPEVNHVPAELPRKNRLARHILTQQLNLEPCKLRCAGADSLFVMLGDQLTILKMFNFAIHPDEVRLSLVAFIQDCANSAQQGYTQSPMNIWMSFLHYHHTPGRFNDQNQIFLHSAARMYQRHLFVVYTDNTKGKTVVKYSGNPGADRRPPMWLGAYGHDKESIPAFQGLYQYAKNDHSKLTSRHLLLDDMASMTRDAIAERLKVAFKHKPQGKGPEVKVKAKVLGYFSRSLSSDTMVRPIYELESMALLQSLSHFRSFVEDSLLTLTLVDSRCVYFIFNSAVDSSCKSRRYGLKITVSYPSVMFCLVPSEANKADWLTRHFDVSETVQRQLSNSRFEIDPDPAFKTNIGIFSAKGMAKQVAENQHLITAIPKGTKAKASQLSVKPSSQKRLDCLNQFMIPIKMLANRLSAASIIGYQQADNLDVYKLLQRLGKVPANRGELIFEDNLIKFTSAKVKCAIYIPEQQVGLCLAYCHLMNGHSGEQKLWEYIKQLYYSPGLRGKVSNLCSTCVSCLPLKAVNRKKHYGAYPTPTDRFQTIFIDLLEDLPPEMGFKHMLVIVEALSGAIFVYNLKSKTSQTVIEALKIFFMHTGMSTNFIICDNGPAFTSAVFTLFVLAMNVTLCDTAIFSSFSRGKVERGVGLIKTIIGKLHSLSPNKDWIHLSFLASVLYNRSVNGSTGQTPFDVLHGAMPDFVLAPHQPGAKGRSRIANASLQRQVNELRALVKIAVATAMNNLELTKANFKKRFKISGKNLKMPQIGDVVFVKSFRKPGQGRSYHFEPFMSRSPFIVISLHPTSVTVQRLVDGVSMRVHQNTLRFFREKTADLYDKLPQEVLDIIGEPLTEEKLISLAKTDELAEIFLEPHIKGKIPTIRPSAASKRQKLEAALMSDMGRTNVDDDDDDDPPAQAQTVPDEVIPEQVEDSPAHNTRSRIRFEDEA
jgi:hypothetical protein